MADQDINFIRSTEKALEIFEADHINRAAFNDGREAQPGVPFVDRSKPITTDDIRAIANKIREKQGLPPLP